MIPGIVTCSRGDWLSPRLFLYPFLLIPLYSNVSLDPSMLPSARSLFTHLTLLLFTFLSPPSSPPFSPAPMSPIFYFPFPYLLFMYPHLMHPHPLTPTGLCFNSCTIYRYILLLLHWPPAMPIITFPSSYVPCVSSSILLHCIQVTGYLDSLPSSSDVSILC